MKVEVVGRIEALALQPGDRVVVTITEKGLTPEQVDVVRAAVMAEIPGHEVLVAYGCTLGVLREVGS